MNKSIHYQPTFPVVNGMMYSAVSINQNVCVCMMQFDIFIVVFKIYAMHNSHRLS